MQIAKIISGDQTDAEQAAMDAAINLGIEHGGWIPEGREYEKGRISYHYRFQEMPSPKPLFAIKQNILYADGTVIFTQGPLSGRCLWAAHMVTRHQKPWCPIDFDRLDPSKAATKIHIWIHYHGVRVLNVISMPESSASNFNKWAYYAVRKLIILEAMEAAPGASPDTIKLADANQRLPIWPRTIEGAVDYLERVLPPDIRFLMAEAGKEAVKRPSNELWNIVGNFLGLWRGNYQLLASAAKHTGRKILSPDEALGVVWEALAEQVVETHRLRVVK
jgi:hypothetical protein